MRRINCSRCGVTVERVPWADGKSPTTRALQWLLARWAQRLGWRRVFWVSWSTVSLGAVGGRIRPGSSELVGYHGDSHLLNIMAVFRVAYRRDRGGFTVCNGYGDQVECDADCADCEDDADVRARLSDRKEFRMALDHSKLSIVIPLYNEWETLPNLARRVKTACVAMRKAA